KSAAQTGPVVTDGLDVEGVDAVLDDRCASRRYPEDAGHVVAHILRAGDDVVGAFHHPSLDCMDVRMRVLLDPTLVAAVLGRVNRDQPRAADAARYGLSHAGYEPIVGVDDIEVESLAQLQRELPHI